MDDGTFIHVTNTPRTHKHSDTRETARVLCLLQARAVGTRPARFVPLVPASVPPPDVSSWPARPCCPCSFSSQERTGSLRETLTSLTRTSLLPGGSRLRMGLQIPWSWSLSLRYFPVIISISTGTTFDFGDTASVGNTHVVVADESLCLLLLIFLFRERHRRDHAASVLKECVSTLLLLLCCAQSLRACRPHCVRSRSTLFRFHTLSHLDGETQVTIEYSSGRTT